MIIRPATPDDLIWVRCSWLASYQDHTTDRRVRAMLSAHEYRSRWRRVIDALIGSGVVLVAAHEDTPDTVLGWLCHTPAEVPRLHYVHVRQALQRRGIARDLLVAAGLVHPAPCWYSHRTTSSDAIHLPEPWQWMPWLVIGV